MDSRLEPLFTPWSIGGCEIKNRIVMTSMGGTNIFGWMERNHFDRDGARFLMERAQNNVGLLLPRLPARLQPHRRPVARPEPIHVRGAQALHGAAARHGRQDVRAAHRWLWTQLHGVGLHGGALHQPAAARAVESPSWTWTRSAPRRPPRPTVGRTRSPPAR
jgi:2,4-dienoyl-CoA reductase-like NADH-dependent reductase (Old Yellow Enzyme family)